MGLDSTRVEHAPEIDAPACVKKGGNERSREAVTHKSKSGSETLPPGLESTVLRALTWNGTCHMPQVRQRGGAITNAFAVVHFDVGPEPSEPQVFQQTSK